MSGCVVIMKLPITSCPQLRPSESAKQFPQGNVQFKLNTKFDADLSIQLLCHFECDSHTVHMLTQQSLPSPLSTIVKLSLFTHVHSSQLSQAARLHQCHANYSHYINNGWTFSGQTSYMVNMFQTKIQGKSMNKRLKDRLLGLRVGNLLGSYCRN